MVLFYPDKKVLVGNPAKNAAEISAARAKNKTEPKLIYDAKRMIGRNWNDPKVQNFRRNWPFEIEEGDPLPIKEKGNDIKIKVPLLADKIEYFKPYEISALVLSYVKTVAEKNLGGEVTSAVITVPAYFGNDERRNTLLAAKLSGLKVLRIINEPTAAALAYSTELGMNKQIVSLIFDLGGGTFDVTILKMIHDEDGTYCDIIATDGDSAFGGRDLENNLFDFLSQKCASLLTEELAKSPSFICKLRNQLEKIKKDLSANPSVEILIEFGDNIFEYTITVDEFNKINEKEFDKCKTVLQKIFKDAEKKVTLNQIDEVILVGGSTYIPKIREIVKNFTKKEPHCSIAPELVVSRGAAVLARSLTSNDLSITFKDIVSKNIGVEEKGENMSVIVNKFSSLPCKKSETFRTMSTQQESILLKVLEGNEPKSQDNFLLFSSIVTVPSGASREPFDIELLINQEGIVDVNIKFSGNKSETRRCETTESLPKFDDKQIEQKRQRIKQYYDYGPLLNSPIQPGISPPIQPVSAQRSQETDVLLKRLDKIIQKAKTITSISSANLSSFEQWLKTHQNASVKEIEDQTEKLLQLTGEWRPVLENLDKKGT